MVILHEEAEDGAAMPDLSRPVDAVSKAVTNLVKVSVTRTIVQLSILFNAHLPCTIVQSGWSRNNQQQRRRDS